MENESQNDVLMEEAIPLPDSNLLLDAVEPVFDATGRLIHKCLNTAGFADYDSYFDSRTYSRAKRTSKTHGKIAFFAAEQMRKGKIDLVVKTIKKYKHQLNAISYYNHEYEHPLIIAVNERNLESLRIVIGALEGTSVDDIGHDNGLDTYSALLIAAETGNVEIVEELINAGANVSATSGPIFKKSAIEVAAMYGHVGVVRLLLEKGCPVDLKEEHGPTPLIVACQHGHYDVAKLLLAWKASTQFELCRETALGISIIGNYPDLVRLLIDNGASWKDDRISGEYSINIAMRKTWWSDDFLVKKVKSLRDLCIARFHPKDLKIYADLGFYQ